MAESSETTQSLYQEFLAERDEIMRHKWLLSETAGSDVGFNTALLDWVLNCRPEWKKEFLKQNKRS